jgi:vacuolar-type H+-ATPase subunit H
VYDNDSERSSNSTQTEASDGGRRPLPLSGRYQIGEAEQVDVFGILNELLELPDKAHRLPFNILVGFDHERFGSLVLKIRANLPEDMKRARKLTREKDKIVAEARDSAEAAKQRAREDAERIVAEGRAEAERIIREAREEAARLVEESEICRVAEAQARETVHRGKLRAREIRRGANDYARDVLTNLEGVLGKAIGTIQRGREMLDQAQDDEE